MKIGNSAAVHLSSLQSAVTLFYNIYGTVLTLLLSMISSAGTASLSFLERG